MTNGWRTIKSLVHKIRLYGRRGKGMAESFSREKLRQAPQKEGGWKILCYLLPVWPRLVRPLKSRMNGKKTQNTRNGRNPPLLYCTLKPIAMILIFSVLLVANPKKLLYTVANPAARGLLNRKKWKKKVRQRTPPPTHPRCSFGENIIKITWRIYRRYACLGRSRVRARTWAKKKIENTFFRWNSHATTVIATS